MESFLRRTSFPISIKPAKSIPAKLIQRPKRRTSTEQHITVSEASGIFACLGGMDLRSHRPRLLQRSMVAGLL